MNFTMIGKLSMPKATEKFSPYSENTYDSGWVKKRLMFNVISGDNRNMLTIDAGAFADGHGDVYTFAEPTVGAEGKKGKSEPLTIPFKDRLTSPKVKEVANFRKFVVDLDNPNRRRELEKAADKIKEGTSLTDEELKKCKVENESEIAEALEKSNKKRHEFISEWDFIDFVKKVLESGKYDDKMFYLRGRGVYSYSENKQQVYENYVPQRIYLADDNAEEFAEASFNILYNKDSLDGMSAEEKHKYYVNGYMIEYDQNRKGNIPVPVTITIPVPNDNAPTIDKKKTERIKQKFIVEDDTWKEFGVVVNMINGAQKMEITDDMLTDEQREDIECGLITLDDIRRDLGGSVYGDRIKEYQFAAVGRGFTTGRHDTVYTDEDMVIKPLESNEEESLFDDDDDEL